MSALLLLAAAVLTVPGRAGSVRAARLWPGRRRRWPRPWAAGPGVLAALAGLLAAGPGGAVAALLVATVVRRRRARRRTTDAAARAAGQLADALRRITDELRAGSHPALALAGHEADGPLAARLLAPAAAAGRLGEDVAAALRAAPGAQGLAGDVDRVAAAWSLAERHGVPLAELLADAHDAIRWRVRFAAGVRAQLAGPRATGAVLAALPLVGLLLGQLVGADPLGVLRAGVLGQGLLVTGVALSAAGSAWTERILAAAVPR